MLTTETIAQVVIPNEPNEAITIKKSSTKYQEAISLLNTLQTSAEVISASLDEPLIKRQNVLRTKHYLSLLGITEEQVDKLNIIHVAGTKGKGSTCAFTESILRHHGYKTGLFTSPHLVAVRERIRINGDPISEDMWVHYFWNTMNAIRAKESESIFKDIPPLPSYPMFSVIMGMNVFIHEGIEALVLEVGVGGEYDCTNFIKKPIVTGITSLGMDHIVILGDTIDQIAWQKSGIFKEDVPAFTVDQDDEIAMNVLLERAVEKKCRLTKVPTLPAHDSRRLNHSSSCLPCLPDLDSRHAASVSSIDDDCRHPSETNFVNSLHQTHSLHFEGINYSHISWRCDDERHANVNSRHQQLLQSEKEINTETTLTGIPNQTLGEKSMSQDIPVLLGIPGDVQRMNASLAIQLSHTWLKRQRARRCHVENNSIYSHTNNNCNGSQTERDSIQELSIDLRKLPKETLLGLANTRWPGRYQVFPSVGGDPDLIYFLDGAHTKESIGLCAKWFSETSTNMQLQLERTSQEKVKVYRMMIFNITGRRNASELILPLVSCDGPSSSKFRGLDFDYIVCSPNRLHQEISTTSDQSNFCVDADAEAKKSVNLAFQFKKMYLESRGNPCKEPVSESVPCLTHAISWIQDKKDQLSKEDSSTRVHVHTLVTGSLLLVGGVLGIIDPHLKSFKFNNTS